MAKKWLEARWVSLGERLVSAKREKQIKQICEEEIASWKARPSMKSISSLKEPMSDTRNFIRTLPLTQGMMRYALEHMNYSEEEWAAMNKPKTSVSKRIETRMIIDKPDEILEKIEILLTSDKWKYRVVGLALATGRRLSELLSVGSIEVKDETSVIFRGQLKQRDKAFSYTIPTLVDSQLCIDALEFIRKTKPDIMEMDTELIGKTYSVVLGDVANDQLGDLIPARGRLTIRVLRDVYARLAHYLYCPPAIADIAYMSAIMGHRVHLENGDTELNLSTTLHYFDYVVVSGGK
jgi:integrase